MNKYFTLVLALSVLYGCQKSPPIGLPPPFHSAMVGLGWTPVDLPRGILKPGSIVSIDEIDGLRYRGHIESCIDRDIVEAMIKSDVAALPSTFNRTLSFDAGISASVPAAELSIKPHLEKMQTIAIDIGRTEEYVVDEILLSRELEKIVDGSDRQCKGYLIGRSPTEASELGGNIFILTNVLRAIEYSYEFYDENGAKIELSADKIKDLVEVELGLDVKLVDDGKIKVSEPVTLAFKKAYFYDDSNVAGAAGGENQATKMFKIYLKRKSLLE